MEKYNICFSLDSNYVEQFVVSATSILKNAKADENICLYILDGGLTKTHKEYIEQLKEIKPFEINYIQMDNSEFKNCPMLCDMNKNFDDYHVTVPTYYRFKLAEVLPKIDKILYLDIDIMFNGDIKNILTQLQLTDYDPLQIVEKTRGRTVDDDMWLRFNYYPREGAVRV